MNEGINYKILLGLIIMVLGLFFGVNYLVNRMHSKATNSKTATNQTSNQTNNSATNQPADVENTSTNQISDLTNVDLKTLQDKSIVLLGQADNVISKWQAGLGFYNLTIDIPTDLSIGKSKQTFAYGSDTNQDYWFTVSYSEDSSKYVRAILPKEDYLGKNLLPIKKDFWKVNYVKAFQAAEKFKGKDFRTKNEIGSITASLSQNDPKGWLWWIITYTTKAGDSTSVRINANTGDVNDEAGQIIVPAESTTESTQTTTTKQ